MRALNDKRKLDRRIYKRPRKIVAEFEKSVVRELGIVPGQPWTLLDWWRKIEFGKLKGISRCTLILLTILEQLRRGDHEIAAAQTVQGLKAMRQVALDGGHWDIAWELTGIQDHLRSEEFAGSFEDLTAISAYRKYRRELKAGSRLPPPDPVVSGDDAGQAGAGRYRRKKGPKGGGKGDVGEKPPE